VGVVTEILFGLSHGRLNKQMERGLYETIDTHALTMAAWKKTVLVPEALPPLPVLCKLPFCLKFTARPSSFPAQAVITNGFIYLSGNLGCDKDSKLVEGGVQAETVGPILSCFANGHRNIFNDDGSCSACGFGEYDQNPRGGGNKTCKCCQSEYLFG
jgi:hypothetical protein